MAVTYTKLDRGVNEVGQRYVEADVTFANPYTVGGEPVPLLSLGLKEVRAIQIVFTRPPKGRGGASSYTNHGRQVVPVLTSPTAPLLKLFVSQTTESGAIDQTQVVQRIRFLGY